MAKPLPHELVAYLFKHSGPVCYHRILKYERVRVSSPVRYTFVRVKTVCGIRVENCGTRAYADVVNHKWLCKRCFALEADDE